MKKLIKIVPVATLIFSIAVISVLKAQNVKKQAEKQTPIPEEVNAVLDRSCLVCHSDNGQKMAKMPLNFSKWNEYSPSKKATLGKNICKMVSGNKMPPQKYVQKNQDKKLSGEEKKLICDWTKTLESGKPDKPGKPVK